jgi:hypothetical protein
MGVSSRGLNEMDPLAIAIMILSTVITFGLFSILTGKDNPWYAFAEYSYIGAGVGILTVVAIYYLYNSVITPVLANPAGQWTLIVSLVLGALVLTRVSDKYSWIARIPITIGIAIAVGISTRALIFTNVLAQVKASILPIWGIDPFQAVTNILIIVFLVTTLYFFLYTYNTTGKSGSKISLIGRLVLYAGFGTLFAQTFMGRIGLFLGRMNTMLFPQEQYYTTVVIIAVILITVYYLSKKPELMKKLMPESQ